MVHAHADSALLLTCGASRRRLLVVVRASRIPLRRWPIHGRVPLVAAHWRVGLRLVLPLRRSVLELACDVLDPDDADIVHVLVLGPIGVAVRAVRGLPWSPSILSIGVALHPLQPCMAGACPGGAPPSPHWWGEPKEQRKEECRSPHSDSHAARQHREAGGRRSARLCRLASCCAARLRCAVCVGHWHVACHVEVVCSSRSGRAVGSQHSDELWHDLIEQLSCCRRGGQASGCDAQGSADRLQRVGVPAGGRICQGVPGPVAMRAAQAGGDGLVLWPLEERIEDDAHRCRSCACRERCRSRQGVGL